MKLSVFVAEGATKRQVQNAKTLFGTKGESILTSLESANKNKLLLTSQIQDLLTFLKESDESDLVKYKNTVSGKSLIECVKSFHSNKSFEGKLGALGKIKFRRSKSSSRKPHGEIKSRKAKISKISTTALASLKRALLETDDVREGSKLILKGLGIKKGKNIQYDGGIGDNGAEDGIYLRLKSKPDYPRPVLCLLEKREAPFIVRSLGVETPYVVYLDNGKYEGPFLGDNSPVEVVKCKTEEEAVNKFKEMAERLGSAVTYS